jgi:microcystin-dependent protein
LLGSTAIASSTNPQGAVVAQDNVVGVDFYVQDVPNVNMAPTAISPVGGSQPHTNFQPYVCINYIISLFGIFPSPT